MTTTYTPRTARTAAAALIGTMLVVAIASPTIGASKLTRVSVSTNGVETDDDSNYPKVSASGRHVVFMGESDKLVPADKNGQWDVFLRDRRTGRTEWISRGRPGTTNDEISTNPDISADGRYVVFESSASNLVNGDQAGFRDIFLRDRVRDRTTRISRAFGGGDANGNSSSPAISANGRFIVFDSGATNLVNGGSTGHQVFRYDREKRRMKVVSVDTNGGDGGGSEPAISGSGRLVAFESTATDLVPGGSNGQRQIFVRNMRTGTTRQALGTGGVEGSGNSADPALSADGRFLAFDSSSDNLVSSDGNSEYDVFLLNLATDKIRRVSRGVGGAEPDGQSLRPSLSRTGRWIAFDSTAENLVNNDDNGVFDVFVWDRENRRTRRVSLRRNGTQSSQGNSPSAISDDGRVVAFNAWGPLFSGDKNGVDDVYVRAPLR